MPENIIDPTDPQPLTPPTSDIQRQPTVLVPPAFQFSPPNPIYAMAYGDGSRVARTDVEYRLQRLERGQKVIRRGRVAISLPQFRAQSFISQTSANNPFAQHNQGTITLPAGQVPDTVSPTTNNSNIRFPKTPDQL